jgi:hypothetical protein
MAAAQDRTSGPAIEIAPELRASATAETPLNIRVNLDNLPRQSMVVIRGLPSQMTLNGARSFGPDVWAVAVANVEQLVLAPAKGLSGQTDITVALISLEGVTLAETKSRLIVGGVAAPPSGTAAAPAPRPDRSVALTAGPLGTAPPNAARGSAVTPSRLTPADEDQARKMMQKGDESMASGKVTSARLFYQSAADLGWAPAALAMGGTYDSNELARSQVVGGVQSDNAQARKWYEKALELGSPQAAQRLRRLSER